MEVSSRNIRKLSLLGPSGAVGAAMEELITDREDVYVLTADLCTFSGLDRFKMRYPGKIFNMGIAEQNMVAAAAGMAKEGLTPFVTSYATFLCARAADSVRVNLSYMKLPVKLIGLTSGYAAGFLGATHMCIEDIAFMRCLPNMTVISPADCTEIVKAVIASADTDAPVYIRLTGNMPSSIVYTGDYDFVIGKAVKLKEGGDICFFACGSMVYTVMKVAEELEEMGINSTVINMHTIKPLDKDIIDEMAGKTKLFVTVEEHSVLGGLGSAIAEYISNKKTGPVLERVGIEDFFVKAGDYEYQLAESGLSGVQIKERVLKVYKDIV